MKITDEQQMKINAIRENAKERLTETRDRRKSKETREKMKRSAERRWRKVRGEVSPLAQKAGEMVVEKIEDLFKEWNLKVEDSLFIVDALDEHGEPDFRHQQREKDLAVVSGIAVGVLDEHEAVSEVLIWCSGNERVNAETENTGNVVLIRKVGEEFVVESYKEVEEGRVKSNIG